MKNLTLKQKAAMANGRSHMCKDCKIGTLKCSMNYMEACSKAFIEGYLKGYKQKSEELKCKE